MVEIDDNSRRTYNTNTEIKLKTTLLRSILCDYSDAQVLVSWTITIPGRREGQPTKQADERNKGV